MKKSKAITIAIIVLLIIVFLTSFSIFKINSASELHSIKSQAQLKGFYNNDNSEVPELLARIIGMPFSFTFPHYYDDSDGIITDIDGVILNTSQSTSSSSKGDLSSILENSQSFTSSSKDYSTTNIQVENVDEADITKTDGNYIYSISDNKVIITNASNPENIKISSEISINTGVPEDLILYKNVLVIISASETSSFNNNTLVEIYDIANKEAPIKLKCYELYEPYYTSRCIGNKLYIMSSGSLRKEGSDIITYYKEDNKQVDLSLENIKYLKDIKTNVQTLISTVDLDNPTANINLQSYLMDINNAYVSQNNIYLLNNKYNNKYYNATPPISSLFTLKGAIGPFVYEYENTDDTYSNYTTDIYKFNILDDGSIKYDTKTKIDGQTINQFSVDEYNGNLRVALYDNNGSKVVVFNEKLDKIGETSYLAKGEKMYSSRFIGNKAYLVTYRTVDPLYVIDLSNPTNPTVLGELKIPGYSTYLHPYDENHLIGIGMETKEKVNRDSYGKVISTTASIVGMKMALFDVSDVSNPIQISSTVIGDSRATSAILTNHKALLFSKEKELIAIPVNNYSEDFEINNSSNSYSSIINSYTSYRKNYISEGYWVYNINLKNGFNLKGKITHNPTSSKYSYSTNSKLLRGLYIEDKLYTVSEDLIQVNNLSDLDIISSLNLRTGKSTNASSNNLENANNNTTTTNNTNLSTNNTVQNNINSNNNNITY